MLTLADISIGQTAIIQEVTGDDSLAMRIMEMGLIDGQSVRVIGLAPLGDPVEGEVSGYRLSLPMAEARRVLVESQK
ncbi:MAG TPA: iron transporter [Planctomycetaceae bacterium]|nr:iron transporter [Planctomycetaceae bacterium]